MPQGLQIWDAAGNIKMDTAYRLAIILGEIVVASDGAMVIPLPAGGTAFAYTVPMDGFDVSNGVGQYALPVVKMVGATLSWQYAMFASRTTTKIIYGMY